MGKKTIFPVLIILLIATGVFVWLKSEKALKTNKGQVNLTNRSLNTMAENLFTIKTSAFKNGKPVPAKYTCEGEDINPLIEIQNKPAGTKSLALIVEDPDAPGGTWVHWLVWNIDPKTQYIHEDSLPAGAVEGTTSFGKIGYGGPCPPRGDKPHRYFFRAYALDRELDLPSGADKNALLQAMDGHIIGETEIYGTYARP